MQLVRSQHYYTLAKQTVFEMESMSAPVQDNVDGDTLVPHTLFCRLITKSADRSELVSEFVRALHLVTVMVNGSEEDERLFSAVNRVKSSIRSRLSNHLEDAIRFAAQPKFTLSTFPFVDALEHWKNGMNVVRYGQNRAAQ